MALKRASDQPATKPSSPEELRQFLIDSNFVVKPRHWPVVDFDHFIYKIENTACNPGGFSMIGTGFTYPFGRLA